jgi:cytochrome bd-type quinol oxidase subunit 1
VSEEKLAWGLGDCGLFVLVLVGSWLSGDFILVTNAFMQHPVGYHLGADGTLGLASLSAYVGSAVKKALEEKGHEVVSVGRKSGNWQADIPTPTA